MKKSNVAVLVLTFVVTIFSSSFVQAFELVTREMMEKEIVTETDLIRTVDNFIVLFDTSGTANDMVPGRTVSKIQATKEFLKMRNSWLPELGYNAGLYIYTDNKTLAGSFHELYGMQPYDRANFGAAINALPDKGEGPAMLRPGLSALRKVVAGLSGRTAVIMFTDGRTSDTRGPKKPVEIAREIAEDNDVCFYLISSATEDTQEKLLEAISSVNACSRVIPLHRFLDNPHYLGGALFTVRTTSYARLRPTTKVVGAIADDILFDFDSFAIPERYNDQLDKIGNYMKDNPETYVVAAGFSDSAGDPEYNLALSKIRARRVRDYLVRNFSIDEDRIVLLWFGSQNPVADNATSEGRQRNRRVEIAVGGI